MPDDTETFIRLRREALEQEPSAFLSSPDDNRALDPLLMSVFAEGGGIDEWEGLGFGPDGNLYVVSEGIDEVFRQNGVTGAFIDIFVEEGSGGLGEPTFMLFAPLVVPEPDTLALLGVGLLALAFSRRRHVG